MARLLEMLLSTTALRAPDGEGGGGGDGGAGDGGGSGDGGNGGGDGGQGGGDPPKPVRPEGLADDYWSDDNGVAFDKVTADLADLTARRQAEAERAANIPEKPEDYEIALPEGFDIPEGLTFEANPDDPLAAPAREFAAKHGLTKDAFKELVALQLQGQAAEEAKVKAAVAEEMTKLGTKGQARVDALVKQLGGQLGNEAANKLLPMMFTAAQVEALEKLSKAAAQGGLIFTAGGRESEGKNEPSDEEWDRMGATDKIAAGRKLRESAR